jgi:cytochrome P450
MSANHALDLTSYNPMAKEIQQNPFPYYAALRARSPVHRLGESNVYCISRMSTLRDVLGKPEIFSSEASNAATRVRDPDLLKRLVEILETGYPPKDTMLTCDPPVQTRYRQTVGKAFSARRVQELEPRVRAAADAMIDAWPAKGRVDFMNQFAVGFPVRVIAELLGMEREREADIKRWSDDSVAALGVDLQGERRLAAARGVVELQHYWAERFEACRANRSDDLISDLAHAKFQEADGSRRLLTMPELLSIVQQLMVAGNETTTKLLNATMKLLLENEGEWEAIRSDPARIEGVVEESLRLSTPNQGMFRQVREEGVVEGGGVRARRTLLHRGAARTARGPGGPGAALAATARSETRRGQHLRVRAQLHPARTLRSHAGDGARRSLNARSRRRRFAVLPDPASRIETPDSKLETASATSASVAPARAAIARCPMTSRTTRIGESRNVSNQAAIFGSLCR